MKSSKTARAAALSIAVALVGSLFNCRQAQAHGDWGHVHVTGWAIENLPNGELRELFADPEVFAAGLYGASFPDAGYWADEPAHRELAEYSHWEPFVQGFIEYIRANDPPPFESLESRKLVGFLLGCAAHGLQDEIFDSLFLLQTREHDHHGQNEADGGTDFFLYDDGYYRFSVEEFVPTDVLLDLYADLPQTISADTIRESVEAQTRSYVNDTLYPIFAMSFVEDSRRTIPWASEHYMDPEVPGSLLSEVTPTLRYMEAVWERLHGRWDERDLVVHAFPEEPRRLRGHLAENVDSWVTLILGRAITEPGGELLDADGNRVAASTTGTRWGHPYPRLVRFLPDEDLEPGAIYTARLHAGAELIGGGMTTEASELSFQVSCTSPDDPVCPPLGEIDIPVIDGTFVPPPVDGDPEDDSCAIAPSAGSSAWPLSIAIFALLVSRYLESDRRARKRS